MKYLFKPVAMVIFGLFIIPVVAIADEDLEDRVHSAIAAQYRLVGEPGGVVAITVEKEDEGTVVLRGEVHTLYDKYRIHEITSGISGVRKIANHLRVSTEPVPDAIIRDNILDEMQYNSAIVEPEKIEVRVDSGLVYLSGDVSFYREKMMMRTIASWQKGVIGIINTIDVKPPEKAFSDENIKSLLYSILEDQYNTSTENVEITVNQGRVTVNGTVRNLWTKRNIEEEFQNVIGVLEVNNYLDLEES